MGKIGTERKVNKESFKSMLTRLWRIRGLVVFQEVQDNVWLFELSDGGDKRRILEGCPWSFDRQILVLNEFDGSTPPSQMQFTHSPFWVQVHDMPLLCMTKIVATKIGESMGKLEDVDMAGNRASWGRWLRIQVKLNLRQPLEIGRALLLMGKSHWVTIKYEKLPLFSYCQNMVGPGGNEVLINDGEGDGPQYTKIGGGDLKGLKDGGSKKMTPGKYQMGGT